MLDQSQQSGEIVTIQWEKQSVQLTGTDLQRLVLINSLTNPGESWLNDKVTLTSLQVLICVTRDTYMNTHTHTVTQQLLYILLLLACTRSESKTGILL